MSSHTQTLDVSQNRQRLSKMLQLHGYSACREALVLLEDHYTSSTKYESIEDFISRLNRVITFETNAGSSIIDSDLAYTAIKKLCNPQNQQLSNDAKDQESVALDGDQVEQSTTEPTNNLNIKVKNVQYDQFDLKLSLNKVGKFSEKQENEFNIHYNFLYKRLSAMPIWQADFKLTKLETLTASSQPSIRCICFGLIIKDISKIDSYMLIDNTGRVPVKITPDTAFKNRLAYSDCIVLVEGVYVNPDDILYAANIGLPPILLDPITDKSLACIDDKLVVIIRELFLDDDDVCNSLELLFTGYNSLEEPPVLFVLIGDFTRIPYPADSFKVHMKKLVRIIRSCDNLKNCHFVFVPGQHDTNYIPTNDENLIQDKDKLYTMPKPPLTKEHLPVNLFNLSNFHNIHLATNPTHIYLGERQISIVNQPYIRELKKNLLHDLSDHREELFETIKKIILSNAHLAAGTTKTFHSSMSLWHKPDLLVLGDTEAFGNRYDYSSSSVCDTSFSTVPSFSRQSSQFKVYYVKSGEVEDSQVSSDVIEDLVNVDDENIEMIEEQRSELD